MSNFFRKNTTSLVQDSSSPIGERSWIGVLVFVSARMSSMVMLMMSVLFRGMYVGGGGGGCAFGSEWNCNCLGKNTGIPLRMLLVQPELLLTG